MCENLLNMGSNIKVLDDLSLVTFDNLLAIVKAASN